MEYMDGKGWGKLAYDTYWIRMGGKTFDGKDLPDWEQLPEMVREAWRLAANAVWQQAQ